MTDLKGAITDRGFAAGWRLVRALPEATARRWFDRGGNWAAERSERGAQPSQLRRNLARVLGVPAAEVPAELIAASMRSYARYWREAFRLPSMDHAAIGRSELLPVEGLEHLDAALARGKGMILALPHSGNYDMAGLWLVQNYGRFATVAERLRPESLYNQFLAYRQGLGFEVFALTGGAEPPFPQLAQRLRDNGIVCLMGERDLTGRGVPVVFFGERTWLPAGAAKLAVETGAALLPVHLWFTETADGREAWGLKVEAPLDVSAGVAAATQALADRFAANIAAHPADWHMLQPLWESDLSPERLARIEAAQSGRTSVSENGGGGGESAVRADGDDDGAGVGESEAVS
ncbi:phosphatidylinositol mannoside acyltransferase [Nocardia stercoris]|uniref:Phosphatidylinositol mannoside acyltransferase n=1 Tax=Nocardia stercoris TaxID=2483361 RepID=A0A3M2KYK9_9NOCA|nr:phosphatidylinositol mannoside acyltransferase [Nocardia stercoris]RMI30579.1 phosphatidylinositol mannoside acyltransferase [Nocardia stercoris]